MREKLESRLGFAQPDARLSLSYDLEITSQDLTVSSTAEITRFTLQGTSKFTVTDRQTGKSLYTDSVRSFTAYGATSETFPTSVARQDAEIRLAQALADLIVTRLSITADNWLP